MESSEKDLETAKSKQAGQQRVFIKTHGCQMNEYDSARMLDLLKQNEGAVLVDSAEQADILLLNTCSIREKAQEKVYFPKLLYDALRQKTHHNPSHRQFLLSQCLA